MPLWPRYADQFASNDYASVMRTLVTSLAVAGLAAGVLITILLFIGDWLLGAWIGASIQINKSILLAVAVMSFLSGLTAPIAIFLNGLHALKFQVIWAVVMAPLNLAISVILVYRLGSQGAAWGTVLAQIFAFIIPSVVWIIFLSRRWSISAGLGKPGD